VCKNYGFFESIVEEDCFQRYIKRFGNDLVEYTRNLLQ